jgi:hypothetical protein
LSPEEITFLIAESKWHLCLEVFTTTELNKAFLGGQPRQGIYKNPSVNFPFLKSQNHAFPISNVCGTTPSTCRQSFETHIL